MAYKAIDKKKLAQILTDHAVGMKKSTYSEGDVTDDMLKSFNDGMTEHMKKYPKFDVDLNDYTGEADDKFIENVLLPTAEKGGFNLFESEGDKPEEKPEDIKDMLENAASEMAISDEAVNKLYAHVQQYHAENLPELEQIIAEFIDVDKSNAAGIVLVDDQRTAAGDALKAWMDGIDGMSFGEGFSVVMGEPTNESGYETWVENGTLDNIIKRIQDEAKGKTGDELNKIATDIINDENFHGDKKDMVQSREYILDKVKAEYVGEASKEVQIDQLVDDIYDIIEDTETRGQVENIILNHFGHDLEQSKIDDVIAQLRDKGVEIYENTDASLAKEIATDLKPKLEKIRDEKGKVTVKDLEDIINAGDGNKDGKNTTTDLVMAELVNMGLDFDTSESLNPNPYTFDTFMLTDGEEYSMEQDGKKSRVTFMGYDEEVPDGRGYLFDTNGKVEHFTRAEVEQMVSESEEVEPIDESQEGFGDIQDYYQAAKDAQTKKIIRGLTKLHQGDGQPINYYFRFIHVGDNEAEVEVAYNTDWQGIQMSQDYSDGNPPSDDDISLDGFKQYIAESVEGEAEEFEINEAITSSDLQWAIKNAEILNDWYAGSVPSGETAKRLRGVIPDDHPFPDEVENKIKELEGMSKPDNKMSSGSLYAWFTDIDTDYHHGLPDYEEANSALRRLLHEEAEEGAEGEVDESKDVKIAGEMWTEAELQDVKFGIEKAFKMKFEEIEKEKLFHTRVIDGSKANREKMYQALLNVEAKDTGALSENKKLTDADKEILKQVDTMDREEFNKKEKAIIDRGVPVEDIRKFYTDELDAIPEASAVNESAEEVEGAENIEENETAQAGAAENTDESSKYKAPKHFILGEAMRLIDAHLTGKMKQEDVVKELEEYYDIFKDQTGNKFGKPVKEIAKEYADAIEFVKTGKVEGVEDRFLQINETVEIDYLELSNGETTVSLYKEGRHWHEGNVVDGEKPYGWGDKKYQSYLEAADIAKWLNQDYGGQWTVTLEENKGAEDVNEQLTDDEVAKDLIAKWSDYPSAEEVMNELVLALHGHPKGSMVGKKPEEVLKTAKDLLNKYADSNQKKEIDAIEMYQVFPDTNEGYADGMMGSELDWEQFVEKMNDGEDVRSDGTRKQTFVEKEVWADMLMNQDKYEKAYPKVIIESNGDGDVTDTEGEPVTESLIKSKEELKVGEKYLTPSGLGGAFHVEYLGVNDKGRHEFKNINDKSDFHGQLYSFDDVSVLKEIHQDGTSVYETDIQHRWGQGTPYDDKSKFDQALSYMAKKMDSFDEGDATHYQDENGNNIGVWDNDLMQGVVYDKVNEEEGAEKPENGEEPSMTYEQCESYCQDKGIDEEDIDQLTNKLVEMDDEMELDGVFTEKQLTDAINELGIELKQNLQGDGASAAVDNVPGSEVQDQIAKNTGNANEEEEQEIEENNEPQLPGKQSEGEYNSIMKLSTQRTMEQVNESSSVGRRNREPLPTFESFKKEEPVTESKQDDLLEMMRDYINHKFDGSATEKEALPEMDGLIGALEPQDQKEIDRDDVIDQLKSEGLIK